MLNRDKMAAGKGDGMKRAKREKIRKSVRWGMRVLLGERQGGGAGRVPGVCVGGGRRHESVRRGRESEKKVWRESGRKQEEIGGLWR